MKFAGRLFIVGLSVLTAALVVFLSAEILLYRQQSRSATIGYGPVLYTSDGIRLGSRSGGLQLILKPLTVYGNRPNQRTPKFSTDARGFRTTVPSNDGTRDKIILLGGSTAFGAGLPRDEDTFASQLAHQLKVQVLNAGVAGFQSGQELAYLVTELIDLRPTIVLTLDGWNDFGIRPQRAEFLGAANFEQVEGYLRGVHLLTQSPAAMRPALIPLILFPRTGQWLIDRLSRFGRPVSPPRRQPHPRHTIEAAATRYATNIAKMNELAVPFRFRFLCVIQPQKRGIGFEKKNEEYAFFREVTVRQLAEQGVSYIDLSDDQYRNKLSDDGFLDEMHPDAANTKLMAKLVAAEIAHLDLLGVGRSVQFSH